MESLDLIEQWAVDKGYWRVFRNVIGRESVVITPEDPDKGECRCSVKVYVILNHRVIVRPWEGGLFLLEEDRYPSHLDLRDPDFFVKLWQQISRIVFNHARA